MAGTSLLAAGAAALGLAIALLSFMLLAGKPAKRGVAGALESIERHYGQQPAAVPQRGTPPATLSLPAWTRNLAVRLSPAGVAGNLQRRLDLAGNPAGWTADRILALKGVALLAGAALGVLFGLSSPALAIVYAAIGGAAGFFLPDLLVYNSGLKRQEKILLALPDALDMLTVCVEAGLSFDGALAQVARNSGGPLAEEFARTLQEMQIGLSRADALRGMAGRTSVAELRSFVSSLIQASELGIPVARVLREQASEMRVRRRQRAEEKAQKVPVKIMFPLILCLFPALMVIVIGPGVITIARSLFGL
jgi:tight adherence protein C